MMIEINCEIVSLIVMMAEVNGTQPPSFGTNPMFTTMWIALVILLAVSFAVYRSMVASKGSKLKLPSMPKGLSIIGTILQTKGPQTHHILSDISKKFGRIFVLKTGLKYFIMMMSSNIAHEALIEKSQVFSSRPKLISRLNFAGWRSVNSTMYGQY